MSAPVALERDRVRPVDQVVPLAAIGPLLVAIVRGTPSAATHATARETGGWT